MRLNEAIIFTDRTVLTEGVGDLIVRAVASVSAGAVGYGLGIAIGNQLYYNGLVYSIILSLGFASPAAVLFGVTTATAGATVAAFMIAGDAAGKWINKQTSTAKHVADMRELIRVTRQRDDILGTITSVETAKTYKGLLDRLTANQISASKRLKTSVNLDFKKGLISDSDFESVNKIVQLGSTGKLTYIEKK